VGKSLTNKDILLTGVYVVPISFAAPAALVASAYLNARWQLGYDLSILSSLILAQIGSRKLDRQDRVNIFYRLEEKAQSPKDAERTFLIYEGKRWSYKEAYGLTLKYGTWLKNTHGVNPKEIVALDATNVPKTVFLMLGLWSIGAYPAFINYNLTDKPLLHCIRTSTARIVLVDDEIQDKFSPGVMEALAASDFRSSGGPVKVVVVNYAVEDHIAMLQAVREPDSTRSGAGIVAGDKMALLMYTSGTTGMPKPATG
jgi:acyl-coenzyme A synthetase/AMP-(fatty) acid ligase